MELESKTTKMNANPIPTPEWLWCSQVLDTIGAATLMRAASPISKVSKPLTAFRHLVDHIPWIAWSKGWISLGASIVPLSTRTKKTVRLRKVNYFLNRTKLIWRHTHCPYVHRSDWSSIRCWLDDARAHPYVVKSVTGLLFRVSQSDRDYLGTQLWDGALRKHVSASCYSHPAGCEGPKRPLSSACLNKCPWTKITRELSNTSVERKNKGKERARWERNSFLGWDYPKICQYFTYSPWE